MLIVYKACLKFYCIRKICTHEAYHNLQEINFVLILHKSNESLEVVESIHIFCLIFVLFPLKQTF